MFRTLSPLRSFLALCLLALAAPSHALTEFCVGTASDLHNALGAVVGLTDTQIVIKVRRGTYSVADGGPFFASHSHSNQLVTLTGGWSGDNGACTRHVNDATTTVLVGQGNVHALTFNTNASANETGNTWWVRDLTLRNPAGTGYGPCLFATIGPNHAAAFDRVRFEQCVSQDSGTASALLQNSGQLDVRNVVVRNGSAVANGGMGVTTYSGGESRLSQLSITANLSSQANAPAGGLSLNNVGNGVAYLSNSVVWGNDPQAATKDIVLNGAGIHLVRVHYGSLAGTPASNIGQSTGDPGFVAPGDPHLLADSLLRDSGGDNPAGGTGNFDVEGRARMTGEFVDVGAYEWSEAIFAHDFEQ